MAPSARQPPRLVLDTNVVVAGLLWNGPPRRLLEAAIPQSPEALRRVLADVLEDASNELTGIARLVLQRAQLHWIDLDLQMNWCDERIEAHARSDERASKAAALQGIGPIGASALVASVGDFKQFDNARQFGAWLGLVPRSSTPTAVSA